MKKKSIVFFLYVLFFCIASYSQNRQATERSTPSNNSGQFLLDLPPIVEPIVRDKLPPIDEPVVYDMPVPKSHDADEHEESNIAVAAEPNIDKDAGVTGEENAIEEKIDVAVTQTNIDEDTVASAGENAVEEIDVVIETNIDENTVASVEENDAVNTETISNGSGNESYDDFDNIFADAHDVTVEEQNVAHGNDTPKSNGLDSVVATITNNDNFPIRFSGNLDADAGIGLIFNDPKKDNFSGYFSFRNFLNISARPSKYFSVRSSLRTLFPSLKFDLYEMYVDSILFDKVYVTLGKKVSSWGYTRLFGSNDILDEILINGNPKHRNVKLLPNALYDSINFFSAMIRVPVWTGTLTAIAMYPISDVAAPTSINYRDLSYAFSAEMIFWQTSMNIFARTFERPENMTEENKRPHILGLEVKRTVLGADIYAQGSTQVKYFTGMGKLSGYEAFVVTAGIYRYWDLRGGQRIGGNFEYQYAFFPNNLNKKHHNQIMFSGAISRIGKRRNIKIAIDLEHNFSENKGDVRLGWQFGNLFPNIDWNSGIEFEYGGDYEKFPKITLATILNLKLTY